MTAAHRLCLRTFFACALLALPSVAAAAVTAVVSSGVLDIDVDAADAVVVTCVGGQTRVNGAAPVPATACTTIKAVRITALGAFANTIDASAVTRAQGFTNILLEGGGLVIGGGPTPGVGVGIDAGGGDDTIAGSNDQNVAELIDGGAGSDTIAPGLGATVLEFGPTASPEVDTLTLTVAPSTLDFQVPVSVTAQLDGGLDGNPDAIARHANRTIVRDPASTGRPRSLLGGSGNDVLQGVSGVGTSFEGRGGTDVLVGGSDRDFYRFAGQPGTYTIVDTEGDNALVFDDLSPATPITFDLSGGLGGGVLAHTPGDDVVIMADVATAASFSHVFGSDGDDTGVGNDKDNRFTDCAGDDDYAGGLGNDEFSERVGFLRGGLPLVDCGNDRYAGGPGDDQYIFACHTGPGVETKTVVELADEGDDSLRMTNASCVVGTLLTVDLRNDLVARVAAGVAPPIWTIETGGAGQAANLETVFTGGQTDRVTGNDADNRLFVGTLTALVVGGPGDDTFSGGTVTYATAPGPVDVNLVTGIALGEGTDDVSSVSRVVGSPFADALVAKQTSTVWGGDGDDTLYGSVGTTLEGEGGNDRFVLGGGATARGGPGNDVFTAELFADTMDGGDDDDTFVLSGGLHTVHGGAGADTVDSRNERADDTINCGSGIDVARTDQGDTVNADCESTNPGGMAGPIDTDGLSRVTCGSTAVTFGAASADGTRVVFTTTAALVPTDVDTALDLYAQTPEGLLLLSGGSANVGVTFAGMSADGSRVWFETTEALPGTGDGDASSDVYENEDGALRLVSGGGTGGDVFFAGATPDGAHVYLSTSVALLPEDTNGSSDVYDRHGAGLTLVSGPSPNGTFAFFGGANADGSRVWFTTSASLLPEDTDIFADVYERSAGGLTLVSAPGGGGFFTTFFAGVSADGTRVYFHSDKRIVPPPPGAGGEIELYARTASGLTNFGEATFAAVSADGARVVFTSAAQRVPADTDLVADLYRVENGVVTLLSGGTDGVPVTLRAASADATRIVFETAEALLPGDVDAATDLYANDAGTLVLLTPGTAELPAVFRAAAADATRIFFRTGEALDAADTDEGADIYERSGANVVLRTPGALNLTPFLAGVSADGEIVFFASDEALLPGDLNGGRDIYAVGPSGLPPEPVCSAAPTTTSSSTTTTSVTTTSSTLPPGSTSTTVVSSSTTSSTVPGATTTTLPGGAEVCGNCVDDDADGLTDDADDACCPTSEALRIVKGRVSGKKGDLGVAKLKLKSAPGAAFTTADPTTAPVTIQLADADGAVVCTTLTPWKRKGKRFAFKQAGTGLTKGALASGKKGVALTLAGKSLDLSALDGDQLLMTVRVGDHCARGAAPLRRKGKALVAP